MRAAPVPSATVEIPGLPPARRRALAKRPPVVAALRWSDDHWVRWAHLPGARAAARARTEGAARPILLIGLPRGGTSWLGQVLGGATGAAYLREPLTQSRPPRPEGWGWVEGLGADGPDEQLRSAAEDAFAGLPRFARRVNAERARWAPRDRGVRLVIKEVNPLWLSWLVARHDPIVVHLVRHPAGVAASWDRLGWLRTAPWPAGIGGDVLDESLAHAGLGDDPWARHGLWQAALHRSVVQAGAEVTVRYEDVARDPMEALPPLLAALGLPWDDQLRARVEQYATDRFLPSPFDIHRDASVVAERWRTTLAPDQLAALRRGWELIDQQWFDDADWTPALPIS